MSILLYFIHIDPKLYIRIFVFVIKSRKDFLLKGTDGVFNVHGGYRMNNSKI